MRFAEKFWPRRSTSETSSNEPRDGRAFISNVPTFGQWIRDIWADLLTIIILGAIALALNSIDAVGSKARKFIIWDEQGNFVNYDIGFNRQHNIIPIWLSAFLSVIIPTVVFLVSQLRIRSFYDLHVAFWANIWSIVVASIFQVFNKLLIGGVRPHFLDVCQPDPSIRPGDGVGFHGLYFTSEICRGPNKRWINDALKSWPSGHTSVAFGGFMLLSLYINGHYKVFSDERAALWKITIFFMPILGACLIGGAMILDHSHQWYDVLGGAVIGICTSFACYRASYASVFDHRFNHIPLPRKGSWKLAHGESWPSGSNGGLGSNSGKFIYSTALTQRFPDWAHGSSLTWAPRGAPGNAVDDEAYGGQHTPNSGVPFERNVRNA